MVGALAVLGAENRSARFYMYDGPILDHDWLRHCDGFDDLVLTSQRENLGEVHIRRLLHRHPRRTLDASKASLFYVPIFEYASYVLGACNGTSHRGRMTAARDALVASPYFQRHRGVDHIFASTGWSYASRTAPLKTMWSRMAPLSEALRCGMAGRYKDDRLATMSRVGSCVVELPYPTARIGRRQARQTGQNPQGLARDGQSRPILLHFAGSFDVCCHGKAIR